MAINVLVVDNNPVILKAVTTFLAGEGCRVKPVSSGLEAVECLDMFYPDIVFTDLVMPLVSGEMLCRIIKSTEKYRHIFVVVLSGIVLEDRERILSEVDCDVCIAKGNLGEIRVHIREALQAFRRKGEAVSFDTKRDARIPKGLKPSPIAHELLLEKEHHKSIISNLDEGILELNDEGKIVSANPAILSLLSCQEVAIIGKTLPELDVWGDFREEILRWNESQLIGRGMGVFEIYEESPLTCGAKILSVSLIPAEDGDVVFGLAIFRDITRQYKAEKRNREINDAVRLAKKMDAMSCMAGGVAHDFNNLLTVICGNLDILSMTKKPVDLDDLHALVNQAQKAALVAVDLTRQISWFSHFGIMKREVCEADKVVQRAVDEFFSADGGGSFFLESNLSSNYISVDQDEIVKAIHNILQNSREAVENGAISITVENCFMENPELIAGQYVAAGRYVNVRIEDNGPGIDADQAYRVFDPYYSTKERGSSKGVGLGLTFVYATMRNHGGNVLVSAEEAGGTVVTLYIPLHVEKKDFSEVELPDNVKARRVIFFVDPDRQMQEIGRIMLQHLGFDARVFSESDSLQQELEIYVEGHSGPATPLVILDITENSGEAAASACKKLRSSGPGVRVVAMCGAVLDPIMADYQKYGFDNALPKPFNLDSLRHVINTALSGGIR
jgi:two-component system cell cycle sensor histidine kinase/response regulator CckA